MYEGMYEGMYPKYYEGTFVLPSNILNFIRGATLFS